MEHISLAPKIIFNLGPIPITNSILAVWLAILVLVILSLLGTSKIKLIPSGLQNIWEMVIEALLGMMDSVTQDRTKSIKFFPYIATFFLFIIFANWMELIPGFTIIGTKEIYEGKETITPFFRSANTDLNTTLALALISIVMIQFFGITAIGFFKHVKKFINFSSPVNFFVGILELISEIAKIISFAFRLFGNIFAGEILLVVITFLVPYIIPVPFYFMELFVGFIQALVFSMLSLVFMSMASMDMHEEESH
jgi:F-type H+-transporting ATPase subunit a